MSAAENPLPGLRVLRVRDGAVVLDSHLAALYGGPTRVFNQTIKRNARRFPADFASADSLPLADAVGPSSP